MTTTTKPMTFARHLNTVTFDATEDQVDAYIKIDASLDPADEMEDMISLSVASDEPGKHVMLALSIDKAYELMTNLREALSFLGINDDEV